MYSTNLHVNTDVGAAALFSSDNKAIGVAYGWNGQVKDGSPTQKAKDNALLWSLAPEMAELLPDLIAFAKGFGEFLDWERNKPFSAEEQGVIDKGEEILAKLAHAIPPASVTQNG